MTGTGRWSLALPLALAACQASEEPVERHPFVARSSREIMSTVFEVSVVAGPDLDVATVRPVLERALDEVARIEGVMSPYRDDSELSRVNASAGGEPVPVSSELLGVVTRAVEDCRATDGLMDVTFLPLGRLWDFDAQPFEPPAPGEVEAALALVDCTALEIDVQAGTLRLPREGMGMGLGALAKGYAVDRASAVLTEAGFPAHLVNGGGDVLGRGAKPDGPWMVGIRHPREPQGGLMGRMPLRDAALVTSGDYERYVELNGERYHHVLDVRTGQPARGIVAVSVMAQSAERADALATALLAAGPEEARALLERLEVEALLVYEDGAYDATRGFLARAILEGVD